MKPFHLLILLLVSPYLVSFTPARDDSTSISIGAGGGSYAEVSRTCSGDAFVGDVPYEDVAVAVDHYTPALHVGVGAGSIPPRFARQLFDIEDPPSAIDRLGATPLGRVVYVLPVAGLNLDLVGVDLGVIVPFHQSGYRMSNTQFPFMLRVGERDGLYFRVRMASDLPLMSGGPGLLNWGLGFPIGDPRYRLFVGMSLMVPHGEPYEGLMFGTQFEFPLNRRVFLQLGGSIGGDYSTQYGLSMKTRVVL